MRKILEIDAESVTPATSAVLNGQGIPTGSSVNKRTADLARQALSRFKELARPIGLVMEISKEQFQPIYNGRGENAPLTPLEDTYRSAHSFALFAVTLGNTICREIGRLFDSDEYALATMLDAAASEAAELLATETERYYRDYLLQAGRLRSADSVMQFSPGYCGWHISAQDKLFEALNPGEIGITLNKSYLMDPLKSVSGVIIAGKREIFEHEDNFEFCPECRTRSCIERLKTLRKH